MEVRTRIATYLVRIGRADGSRQEDWDVAQVAYLTARHLLKKHLPNPDFSEELTMAIHAASEDLRRCSALLHDWPATQAQAERVLPVVLRVLQQLKEYRGSPGVR